MSRRQLVSSRFGIQAASSVTQNSGSDMVKPTLRFRNNIVILLVLDVFEMKLGLLKSHHTLWCSPPLYSKDSLFVFILISIPYLHPYQYHINPAFLIISPAPPSLSCYYVGMRGLWRNGKGNADGMGSENCARTEMIRGIYMGDNLWESNNLILILVAG